MRRRQTPSHAAERGHIHWTLLALGAAALILLVIVVGRAILTIITLD